MTGSGVYELRRPSAGPVVLVTAVGEAKGSREAAAALACAGSEPDRAGLLIDVAEGRPPRPSPIVTAGARALEERLAAHLPDAAVASRGAVCRLGGQGERGDDRGESEALDLVAAATPSVRDSAAVVHLPARLLQPALDDPRIRPTAALLRADLARDRALTALVARDLVSRGLRLAVLKQPLGWIAGRLALWGALPTGAFPAGSRASSIGRVTRLLATGAERERGQALVLALGGLFALLAVALALVAIAGAVTGKGRVQRAADLAAISAARSLRDDLPRLLSPARLPDGTPNPSHLEKAAYLARARAVARGVSAGNGVAAGRLRVSFPDGDAFAPVRVRAAVAGEVDLGETRDRRPVADRRAEVEAVAVAEAGAPSSGGDSAPTSATGGGYGGRLVHRNGEGMRPDVGAAFDRMAAAAARDGVTLVVNSGFRSDAEQAALFAAHPDPRWVAPPGKSLHRCATELDLGPESAYGWLAANADRFGFVQRYSWEAWHYGFTAGPEPCTAAGEALDAGGGGGGDGALSGSGGLPAFVPARFRAPLLRAASRWNVSAALLAAQLLAESNFNPYAHSPAGAQGIAQFIPSTAAAYGLHDPFDPDAAIDAQAHLMSDLLRRLGSPQLALAAYNAGPAPVQACQCVPAYPETQAYVTRILALLDGAGALTVPTFEVRLIS